MRKITWIPLLIVIVGICLALAGFAAGGLKGFWVDGSGWHLAEAEHGELVHVNETYTKFENIKVDVDFLQRIEIKEGDAFAVNGANYSRYGGLNVSLDGDTLVVSAKTRNDWWQIDFDFTAWGEERTWLEITFPKGKTLGGVNINGSAANINISAVTGGVININNSFGDVTASSLKAEELILYSDAGDIDMTDVEATGKIDVNNNFGDVTVRNLRADWVSMELDSGNLVFENIQVRECIASNDFGGIEGDGIVADILKMSLNSGSLNADDVTVTELDVENSFGEIIIDRLELKGSGKIENSSGDIELGLLTEEALLSYEFEVDSGSVRVDGRDYGSSVTNRGSNANTRLEVDADFGSISVRFING